MATQCSRFYLLKISWLSCSLASIVLVLTLLIFCQRYYCTSPNSPSPTSSFSRVLPELSFSNRSHHLASHCLEDKLLSTVYGGPPHPQTPLLLWAVQPQCWQDLGPVFWLYPICSASFWDPFPLLPGKSSSFTRQIITFSAIPFVLDPSPSCLSVYSTFLLEPHPVFPCICLLPLGCVYKAYSSLYP